MLGLLNSLLLDFYLKRVSSHFSGGYFAYNRQYIECLPIRQINFAETAARAQHDELVGLVERILSAKKRTPEADTTAWEREIDRLVYNLYDLTPEEIAIVEKTRN